MLQPSDNNQRIVRTVAGRAVHGGLTRQPIVPVQGTGLGANNTPKVPATSIKAPFQRLPHRY